MRRELLLEIGTEEIPAGYIPPALNQIEQLTKNLLAAARIEFGGLSTCGTPRRLVLQIKDVAEQQKELVKEITGPPQKAAFDQDGKPNAAALGFARSQGVNVEDLKLKETEKGCYICVEKKCEAIETKKILKDILPELINSISFPKSMRWGNGEISFARPIRWILALFGQEVIGFELDGVQSGQITYGHRFLAPGPIKVSDPAQYLDTLHQAFVIVDQEKRREAIRAGIEGYQGRFEALGYKGWLEEEVIYLVEYPGVIKGSFEERYLKVPADILIAAMQEHQRYFPLIDREDGRLQPEFLVVTNSSPECRDEVQKGNERVLAARLADGAFFFEEDKKKPLIQWVEDEKGRVFQEDLGSLYEKTRRLIELAQRIAEEIDPGLIPKAGRSALLCKANLGTAIVGEFPKLQGIMGYHYALLSGEDESVAVAIKEHYLPVSSKGELPETLVGAVVSLADKIDTITGCFSVGLIPTGSQDPYGLRRQAQGIVDTIIKHRLALSLKEMVDWSLDLLSRKIKGDAREIAREIEEFFKYRIKVALISKGIKPDEVEAVLAAGFDKPQEVLERGLALTEIRQVPEFESLTLPFKRAVNLARKEGGNKEELKEALLDQAAEQELYQVYQAIKVEVENRLLSRDYTQALQALIRLKQPIDRFFDEVMVMVEEKEVQKNRLALLSGIASLFLGIADLSCLQEK